MTTVTVHASSTYEILVGEGLLPLCGEKIRKVTKAHKIALVTDDTVDRLYAQTVETSLKDAGLEVCKFVFPHGEASKNMNTLTRLYDFLAEQEITRTDAVAALGGGVVGDLAGFAAATFLRGIDFIQLPTTLLAQVDSSVGGKTAVDLPAGKNLAGAFKQPKLVLCDLSTLKTLSDDIFADGMGEAIKYGMIKDKELFGLFQNGNWDEQKETVISRCISIKRDVVEADEFDKGERALLNFGHTLGHAIEKHGNFTAISHGKAVAIGMALMTKFAWKNGISDEQTYKALCGCLRRWGLDFETDIPLKALLPFCMQDKKRENQSISLVLCSEIGKSRVQKMSIPEFYEFFGVKPEERG